MADIVPLFGCGVGSGDGRQLRIQARGDFQAREVVTDAGAELRDLPDSVRAITVERFIEDAVEAVGRTARLRPEGELSVYFAPPDRWCAADEEVPGREIGAMAVAPDGRVLVVGGREPDGVLSSAILSMRDDEGVAIEYERSLPQAAIGQTLHALGPSRFVAFGGVSDDAVLDVAVRIDVGDDPQDIEVQSVPIDLEDGDSDGPRAFAASARLPDGRVAVVGGCRDATIGGCVPSTESVRRDGFVAAVTRGQLAFESIPSLRVPRYDHDVLVARDGVLFAVGGRGPQGVPENTIEVFLPGSGEWLPYGPSLFDPITDRGRNIVGSTLLEGGILVLVLDDGQVVWADEENSGFFPDWCAPDLDPDNPPDAPPCFTELGPGISPRRFLTTLPGERVLVDNFVLGVAQLNRGGFDAIDLSTTAGIGTNPGPRVGARARVLDDGSALLAGGVNPISGTSVETLLLRMRPSLDGPDEAVPNVAALASGSFILHDPGDTSGQPRITAEGLSLQLHPDPGVPRMTTWAMVRSFRSSRFRFEATLLALQEARPRIVLTRGAVARAVVKLEPDGVSLVIREEKGGGFTVDCSKQPTTFSGVPVQIRTIVTTDRIELRIGEQELIECPGLGGGEFAVGIGAEGNGTIDATDLRVTRL